MEFDLVLFIFGVLGSAAPEIYRVYRAKTLEVKLIGSKFLITIAFLALGGVVAIIMGSPNPLSAFYNGAAAPVIVSRIAQGLPPSGTPAGSSALGLSLRRKTEGSVREYLGLLFA